MDIILAVLDFVFRAILLFIMIIAIPFILYLGIKYVDFWFYNRRAMKLRKHVKGYEKPTHWYDKFN